MNDLDSQICRALDELLAADRARIHAFQQDIDAHDGAARAVSPAYKTAEEEYAQTYARTARLLIDLAAR